jgi:hypothetical protein
MFTENARIGAKEARGKEIEERSGPRQVAGIAGTFPQGKQGLEQMHVRVLPSAAAGRRQLLDEAAALRCGHMAFDECQGLVGQTERPVFSRCFDI